MVCAEKSSVDGALKSSGLERWGKGVTQTHVGPSRVTTTDGPRSWSDGQNQFMCCGVLQHRTPAAAQKSVLWCAAKNPHLQPRNHCCSMHQLKLSTLSTKQMFTK
mmetsp:Transcript_47898/g.85510  ORF Transcript_47898/g.85510 Transcript_47898/m.85510 type:complete len:105 (-) Transcript_47898:1047-1361(-)